MVKGGALRRERVTSHVEIALELFGIASIEGSASANRTINYFVKLSEEMSTKGVKSKKFVAHHA